MRTKLAAAVSLLLIAGLLLPQMASARRQTVLGSLTVTKAGGTELMGEVVGVAIVSNPGFEKNINQQLPPYKLPVFVDVDTDDTGAPSGPRILNKRFETTVLLTNTTGSPLDIELQLRDAEGATLGTKELTLPANGTRAVALSELIPAP